VPQAIGEVSLSLSRIRDKWPIVREIQDFEQARKESGSFLSAGSIDLYSPLIDSHGHVLGYAIRGGSRWEIGTSPDFSGEGTHVLTNKNRTLSPISTVFSCPHDDKSSMVPEPTDIR
jgi:hypothetical protein